VRKNEHVQNTIYRIIEIFSKKNVTVILKLVLINYLKVFKKGCFCQIFLRDTKKLCKSDTYLILKARFQGWLEVRYQ